VVMWVAGLVRFASSIPLAVEEADRRTQAIVVLTGGSGRLDEGLDLLQRDMGQRLFVSGVYRGVDVKSLIKAFRRNPLDLEARIGIGAAINTRGNASETAAWMDAQGYQSLRLVTASYHMPRSVLEFRQAMPGADLVAHPVFPDHVKVEKWWAWPGTLELIAGEYTKFLFAWLRHRLDNLSAGMVSK